MNALAAESGVPEDEGEGRKSPVPATGTLGGEAAEEDAGQRLQTMADDIKRSLESEETTEEEKAEARKMLATLQETQARHQLMQERIEAEHRKRKVHEDHMEFLKKQGEELDDLKEKAKSVLARRDEVFQNRNLRWKACMVWPYMNVEGKEEYDELRGKQKDAVDEIWQELCIGSLETALEWNEERKRRSLSVKDFIKEKYESLTEEEKAELQEKRRQFEEKIEAAEVEAEAAAAAAAADRQPHAGGTGVGEAQEEALFGSSESEEEDS